MRPLVWFRNDLRVADNTALAAAAGGGDFGAVGVFLINRAQWADHDWGAPKVDFILRHVAALSAELARRNIALHVLTVDRFADAPAALVKLAKQERCDGLYFNLEYEVNEVTRDVAVRAAFHKQRIEVYAYHDQTVLPPDQLRTGAGQYYRVFTPFKKAWLSAVTLRLPLRIAPAPLRRARSPEPSPAIYTAPRAAATDALAALWPAGEREAHRRLAAFVEHAIHSYRADRDFPALAGTSALSPYLSAGVISPRQCLLAAMQANQGRLDEGDEGITTWISELIWREFYRQVITGFPRVCKHLPFRPETAKIQWRNDPAGFDAWCRGQTGIPIVDAAMRQLAATGWMHNRLRMITAMFLTKDLFIDWRKGEQFFMQQLVDGDLAQNNGGWQWSASTGTDAAPYFRIFNPVTQSRRFDPQGTFIRRYCPELADLDDEAIHDPASLPPIARERLNYPAPIVDHDAARARVMAAFEAIK